MKEQTFQIPIDNQINVTARRIQPSRRARGIFVYAPGAGSGVDDPFIVFAGQYLALRGIVTIRFQFPYQEKGRKRPDVNRVLEQTWRRVLEKVQLAGIRLVAGGRSMGGRIASQVVAQGVPVDGLALFAYPLHAPATPEKWRDSHLPDVAVPTLFCSGTRDTFAQPPELENVSARLARSHLHLLEGADHGFRVLKSSGRTREEVWDEAVGVLLKYHFPHRDQHGREAH